MHAASPARHSQCISQTDASKGLHLAPTQEGEDTYYTTFELMLNQLLSVAAGSGSRCREHPLVLGRQVSLLRRVRVPGVVQGHLRGNALEEADREEGQHRQSVEGACG